MQFFCRRAALSASSISPLLDPGGAQRFRLPQTWRDAGAGHAPHDGRVAVSSLAFLRCIRAGLFARRVSRQRYPIALGQHEPGIRPLPSMGRVSPIAAEPGEPADAKAEVADLRDAGWQASAAVLLSFLADPRRTR